MTDAEPGTRAQRAEQSRSAILDSARREFARHGYAGATVRAIAAGADIDPSMVIRYFGGKRALFIHATSGQVQLPDLTTVPVRRRGRAVAESFMQLWSGPAAQDTFRMLLLSASSDPDAAERMRAVLREQVLPMVEAVTDAGSARTRAGLISATLLGIALTRLVLAAPELTSIPDDELVRLLAATIDRYLTMPL